MQNGRHCETHKFEGTEHKVSTFNFTIDHMNLKVEPHFESKTIKCEQRLKITAKENINNIELDSAGLDIKSIAFSNLNTSYESKNSDSIKEIKTFHTTDDNKLIIPFGVEVPPNTTFYLTIKYSARPKTGFHFIEPDKYYQHKTLHAWTQGEPEDSKHWFPCIDKPQVKFPREISVIVPKEFVIISNGIPDKGQQKEIKSSDNEVEYETKKVSTWKQETPDATYLTSIVIGKFSKIEDTYCREDKDKQHVDLIYCVPHSKGEYTRMSFNDTPNMIKFFEKYLDTSYPYDKYAQVVVEDFDYDGMENTSCTTYYEDVLADKKLLSDPLDDYANRNSVITHELAHQWFGDLVTCKDWSHIWLNEGFANLCEALYWEDKTKNSDEYQYYIIKSARAYFDEACIAYKRPIVFNFYIDPIDLFDAHAYRKGGCVLHMIRNYVGDENFRKSLKSYLDKHRYKSVETDDLRKAFEETTMQNFHEFFKQWVYGAGHPELSIIHSADQSTVKIKVTQNQKATTEFDIDTFKFPLDIKLVFSFANSDDMITEIHSIEISKKEIEATFQVPIDKRGQAGKLEWFSIDPNFKILKEIIYVDSSKEMLIKQLREGEAVYERLQAIESFSNNIGKYSNDSDVIKSLQNAVLKDNFYGVAVDAAKLLGKYTESNEAYESIKKCIYLMKDQKIRNVLITSIVGFEREDEYMLKLFNEILKDDNESYIVRSSAATGIGSIIHKSRNIEQYFSILKATVKEYNCIFKDHIARGAISAIQKLSDNEDEQVLSDVTDFLVSNSNYKSGNTNMIRQTATFALGDFVIKNIKGKNIKEINDVVFNHLERLLKEDTWWNTRLNAVGGLSNAFSGNRVIGLNEESIKKVLNILEGVSKIDVHAEVREKAQKAIKMINESQKDPARVEKTKLHAIKRMTQKRLMYTGWYR
jgi:aminopeptidase N